MASLTTPTAIAAAFIAGTRPAYRLESMKIVEGDTLRALQSYGPHFPIILDYTNSSSFWLNTERNSATTNRHVRAAEVALNESGYKPTGDTMMVDGMLFAEYRLSQG
jgi:hypothetical protein